MSEQLPLVDAEVAAFPACSDTVKARVDELLNWYERNNVTVTRVAVECRPNTLRKFCRKQRKGPFTYRGKEIVAVRGANAMPTQLEFA